MSRTRLRGRPSVAALAAALAGAAILSCDRSPPPPALARQADAGAEIAPPASEASFHVQIVKSAQRLRIARGDEVLSPVAYRVLISGLSGEAGASIEAGFCRGLAGSGAGIGCSDGAKVAAGTIRVQLFSVGAAALDPRIGRKLKEIAFGRGCAALRGLSDGGGFVGGDTLCGVGLGPVSAW